MIITETYDVVKKNGLPAQTIINNQQIP